MIIDQRLAEALNGIVVRPGGLSATVGDLELVAENRRDLRHQLSLTLYRELHSGSVETADPSALMPRQTRDPVYEEMLRAAVPHHHSPELGLVLAVDTDTPESRAVVRLSEVTASVPMQRLLGDLPPVIGETTTVLLDSRRPNVSPGFYYVIGSRSLGAEVRGLLRVFVHLTDPDEAVTAFEVVLRGLEDAELPYHAKVLSTRSAFPRRDGMVVYLADSAIGVDRQIASWLAGRPGIGAETSVFTQQLAPGVSRAEDPADNRPGQMGLSFGQHRCLALATALTRHAAAPDRGTREQAIVDAFREARIDPLNPALNLRLEHADV
jgi:hypothetical protein